jgi:pre-mRNA-processing factor 39
VGDYDAAEDVFRGACVSAMPTHRPPPPSRCSSCHEACEIALLCFGCRSIRPSHNLVLALCSFPSPTFFLAPISGNSLIPDRLFERGAIFVGQDYQGHPFWDKYIEFEERINNYGNIFKIHERLTHIPLYHVDKYYQKFRTYVASRPLLEMADEETLKMFEDEVKRENPEPKAELELDRLLRVKIDAHYYGINQLTSTETHKRWKYESQIKRAYFHVTPIEETELSNWREYLDFEEAEGDVDRTRLLYERCLISCALYDEFWLRYARWLYSKACAEEIEHDEKSRIHPEVQRQIYEEDARITYMRAGCIFVPIGQPTIRLHWARFEEKLERIPVARDIHLAILMEIPEHVETIISLAGLERRHEGYEAALQLLELYVDQHGEGVSGQLTAEQARIMWQCGGEADRARKLFHDRHERYLFSRDFWSAYLDFEMSQPFTAEEQSHDRAKLVHQLMREKAQFHSSAVMALSHKYMAFLLNRGGKEAAHEYMQLDKEVNRYVSASPSPENPPQ